MEKADPQIPSPDGSGQQLNRNRSFKSKQLVRSQAIRESTSPPRTVSPSVRSKDDVNEDNGATVIGNEHLAYSTDSSVAIDIGDVVKSNAVSNNVFSKVQQRNVTRTVDSVLSEVPSHVVGDGDRQQPVEIQITSGGTWESDICPMQRQNKQWVNKRDLLSHNPRVMCVCGPQRRNNSRRSMCCNKQDSGISCSDDIPDDASPDIGTTASSLCNCDNGEEVEGQELVNFIKETLNKNARDRSAMLHVEKELHALVNDSQRCIVRFPVMSSYGRMLVHRVAALFNLAHHLDHNIKNSVVVSKSVVNSLPADVFPEKYDLDLFKARVNRHFLGTSGGRIPCTSFKQWCTTIFPPSPQRTQDTTHAKSILKRDTHSLDEPGSLSRSNSRSKSLEQREMEYERVRRRIFSTDNCNQDESQWPWCSSGPVKLLTPDSGKNKLLKVHSLETHVPPPSSRGPVSKSHSFGGYGGTRQTRLLSRQGDLASSSWRLSPSSSGYKTLSLRSTDSVTPSPTGGASPEPSAGSTGAGWPAVTAVVIHPQTGRPLTNPDGSIYQFDPANPPYLYEANAFLQHQIDEDIEKRRGRLEKQHSFIDQAECQQLNDDRKQAQICCEGSNSSSRRQEDSSCQRIQQQQHDSKPSAITTATDQPKLTAQPKSPIKTKPEPTNVQTFDPTTTQHQAPEISTIQNPETEDALPYEPIVNSHVEQPIVYGKYNHSVSYEKESTNHRTSGDVSANHRPCKEMPEMPHYVTHSGYVHGYRNDEVHSPQMLTHAYMQPDMGMHTMAMHKMPIMQDPNLRQIPMANMIYQAQMHQPYQYVNPCRIEQPMQPIYQQLMPAEEHKLPSSPHAQEGTFRIDPSYPYAPVDYSQCGACVDTSAIHPHHRSYNMSIGGVEVPVLPVQQACPVSNVMLPQPHIQHYPMNDVQWALNRQYHKVGTECPCPAVCPPSYIMYPHMVPQPYQICQQPLYQPAVIEKPDLTTSTRPNSSGHMSKRDSLNNSARNTPQHQTPENNKPYDEGNKEKNDSEIAAKIQQIKEQMAQLNSSKNVGGGTKREDWRRNNGSGILGSHPSHFNGRVGAAGNAWEEEVPMTAEATAIFNILRMRHKNNTYVDRRNPSYPHYRPDQRQDRDRRREREDRERDADTNIPRQYNMYRQMAPGTWCRRSPAPIHPGFNQPRRPHPDPRNGRR